MEPIVVEVVRGDAVESRHRVHAVAVADGRVVAAAGEPGLVTFLRSAAKPVQALSVARARPDLTDEELALASASHLARPEQLAAVRRLLERAQASEDDLECGPEPTRLAHNCSGKHAAMLLLCRERGWAKAGYRLAEHPCQQALRAELERAAGASAIVATAVDGCGVVTYALALEAMARAFARLPELDGAERVLAAMRAHPDLVRGPLSPDTMLMRALPGWTAKGGAEGLLCAVSGEGLALALKVEDGANRALGPAAGAFLRDLGLEPGVLGEPELRNSRGERVGSLRTARVERHR
ncbi:MAG TPA: asparaginase [Gaiellaceae bacterium]|nr:asparaginase [Gaiellaceae bacterium]